LTRSLHRLGACVSRETVLRTSSVAIAGILLLGGCLTGESTRVTSPFFQPEKGVFYRYGNFCGPQFPRYPEGATNAERISFLQGIPPVDDIDRACKAHDLCYEQQGHDEGRCDRSLGEALKWPLGGLGRYNHWIGEHTVRVGCERLADEIYVAVEFLKSRRVSDDPLAEPAWRQLVGSTSLVITTPIQMMLGMGFPKSDGGCFSRANYRYDLFYGASLGVMEYGARVP
jgi:hypothetical protein